MAAPARQDVTRLLEAIDRDDPAAAAELLPIVYEELRQLAHSHLGREPGGGAGQSLQATELVHEAYLRLLGRDPGDDDRWDGRGHFFAAAARAMRRILVDRARARAALKRGGDLGRVDLDAAADELGGATPIESGRPVDLLSLDRAIQRLEQREPRQAEVVLLRYFAGLTIEQTAAALSVSIATVKTDWAYARAWLRRAIAEEQA